MLPMEHRWHASTRKGWARKDSSGMFVRTHTFPSCHPICICRGRPESCTSPRSCTSSLWTLPPSLLKLSLQEVGQLSLSSGFVWPGWNVRIGTPSLTAGTAAPSSSIHDRIIPALPQQDQSTVVISTHQSHAFAKWQSFGAHLIMSPTSRRVDNFATRGTGNGTKGRQQKETWRDESDHPSSRALIQDRVT